MSDRATAAWAPEQLGTILGLWAHPDDETYLMAGIMALATRAGRRVVCVTATRGEEGSQDHERWPPDEMARIRTAELAESLAVLGVTEHLWLDYRDGTCADVPAAEAVQRVIEIIGDVRPDNVLTFGPDGQTGHPDHIAISRWATTAFEVAAPPGATLHYATTTPQWMERYGPQLEPYNVFAPGTPEVTPVDSLSINLELDEEMIDLKLEALEKQLSQTQGLRNAVDQDFWRGGNSLETFRLAGPKSSTPPG
ncbi:MAG: PIG-L deacetylase family protein [Actinomycetota bacterium]